MMKFIIAVLMGPSVAAIRLHEANLVCQIKRQYFNNNISPHENNISSTLPNISPNAISDNILCHDSKTNSNYSTFRKSVVDALRNNNLRYVFD